MPSTSKIPFFSVAMESGESYVEHQGKNQQVGVDSHKQNECSEMREVETFLRFLTCCRYPRVLSHLSDGESEKKSAIDAPFSLHHQVGCGVLSRSVYDNRLFYLFLPFFSSLTCVLMGRLTSGRGDEPPMTPPTHLARLTVLLSMCVGLKCVMLSP